MKLTRERIRIIILGAVFFAVLIVYIFQMMQIQIVDGPAYAQRLTRGSSRTQVIKAARGEIVDRYGKPFAYNETSYDVTFDRALLPREKDNETILRVINILRENGEEWNDSLPIEKQAPYAFMGEEKDISRLKAYLGVNAYATSEDALHWISEKYGLQDYSDEDLRAIAGVRYDMDQKGFNLSTRYTFAKGIKLETAVLIRQMGPSLPGVDIVESAKRGYEDGGLAPHLVGRVGPIYANELQRYLDKDRGYALDDLVGKEGVEQVYEDDLRGIDGTRRVYLNADGEVVNVVEETPPTPGKTVVLTLDKNLQQVATDALVAQIKHLNETAPVGKGREANAGAVAVVEIKTGDILALVSYPSYDLSTYSQDYEQLRDDPLHPLFDRALTGVYAPGSCFKPVVAVAGLDKGVIQPDTRVNCTMKYTYYPDFQPTCLGAHGYVNVVDALRESCNIFFYDTGRQLGIPIINEYARMLGLGSPTGIELPESIGSQNDPYTKRYGDVLQASIGQLDNGYTPLQLANYTATLARDGKRGKASIVRAVSSYNFDEPIQENTVQIVEDMGLPSSIFETVREGMVQVSRIGTARGTFANYPIDVAAKTGTPETQQFPNSTFIAYAPAEDPQIAVAVVIEKGWQGYTGAPVARAIFNEYFFPDGDFELVQGVGEMVP